MNNLDLYFPLFYFFPNTADSNNNNGCLSHFDSFNTYTHANFTYVDNDKDNTCLSSIRHTGVLKA
jgi:hypothetical protein